MSKLLIPGLFLLFCAPSFAKGSRSPTAEVEAVLLKYRQAAAIRAKVRKTVVQEVMGSETHGRGEFYFSKGRLRLDITEPERTVLVYDGRHVWLESRLDQVISVTKITAVELKKSDSLLAVLFDKKDVLNTFRLLGKKDVGGTKVYIFEPRDKAKTEVQYLELALKSSDLARITYRDQVENKVSFEFDKLAAAEVSASKFKYKLPKGATVTEIK
jgi:outer membrane lipoprotein-sorting protein